MTRALRGGFFLCAGAVLLHASCAAQRLKEDEIDVIATVTDDSQDFSLLRTYSLPTQLAELCNPIPPPGSGGESAGGEGGATSRGCFSPDHGRDEAVLAALEGELDGLGYERVPPSGDPDVVILAGIVAQPYLFVREEGVEWCDASPAFPGCWPVDYHHDEVLAGGTVVIDMALTSESLDEGFLRVPWTAVLANLLTTGLPSQQETRAAVEQAFIQSPALAEVGGQ